MLFDKDDPITEKNIFKCPFCEASQIVKCGTREKKHETVQMFNCKKCNKKFTPNITKNRTFPLRVILESLTQYNKLDTLERSAAIVSGKYGIKVSATNIHNWLKDFHDFVPFHNRKMREFIGKKYDKKDVFVGSRMMHGLIYDFFYHRAKADLIIDDDFKHYGFKPLQDLLELVINECPHAQFTQGGKRASEIKGHFDLEQVKITRKENVATRTAAMILQAVSNNKLRHEVLQKFMLINDSVTVATEVPILLTQDDLSHYKHELGFKIPITLKDDEMITGHIDFVQIRNGAIHILDFKPSAKKERPIDQLMIYALALSRLTGLRLFHIKCAWFDQEDYFEFFPLHVVYKKKGRKK